MSTYDPDSVPCECGHMQGIHKARGPRACATAGCGCGGFRVRKPGAPAAPEPPRVVQGRVERELPPAAPGPVTLTRVQLAICPACDIDRCDTCLGEGCACACNDMPAAGPRDHQEKTMTTHPGKPATDTADAVNRFARHLRGRMRALGWDTAALAKQAGLTERITVRALNGTYADLATAEKLADLVGSSLVAMLGHYQCPTCTGEPPKGFRCLECGTEARAA